MRYECINTWDKFNENLPLSKECFFNEFCFFKVITDKDYKQALRICNRLNKLCEYQKPYKIIGILLLSDFSQNLRNNVHKR